MFAVHAITSGIWGPRLPAIKADLGLGDGELGTALAGVALGLLVGTRLAGAAVDRFGSRPLLRLGLPLYCASPVLLAVAWDGVSLFCALLVYGLVGGALDVAMNSQGVEVERGLARPVLARLHGIWSVGLGIGAGAAALGAAAGLTPLANFALAGGALAAVSIAITGSLLHAGRSRQPGKSSGRAVRKWRRALIVLGAIAFCSFVGEGSAADWAAVYLSQEQGAAPGLAAAAFAGFAIGMAGVRFGADRLRARLGSLALIRIGGTIAGAGLALGLVIDVPASTIGGFFCLGLGLGPVVPIVFSAVGALEPSATGRLVSIAAAAGYVGGIVGPVVIGWIADAADLRLALALPAALAFAIALLAGAAQPAIASASRQSSGGVVPSRSGNRGSPSSGSGCQGSA